MYNIEKSLDLMINFLSKKQNPIILEFGVERGVSTKKFIDFETKVRVFTFCMHPSLNTSCLTQKVSLKTFSNDNMTSYERNLDF